MAYYRIYCLDAKLHIVDVEHFEADGDAAAVLKVESNDSCFVRELWNQERKVLEFAGTPLAPPAAQDRHQQPS